MKFLQLLVLPALALAVAVPQPAPEAVPDAVPEAIPEAAPQSINLLGLPPLRTDPICIRSCLINVTACQPAVLTNLAALLGWYVFSLFRLV